MWRVVGVLLLALAGCGAPIERPYSEAELEMQCVMRGGWWRPDQLVGGFCEFQGSGFL